jgi:hypothetical protein
MADPPTNTKPSAQTSMYTPSHIGKKVAAAASPMPTETLDTEVANATPVYADPYQSATFTHTVLITLLSFPALAAILESDGCANALLLRPCDSDNNNASEYLMNGLRLGSAVVETETVVPVVPQNSED